ncbi:hypothetical protein FJY84_02125 [Candidatus Bathyarchaeota archaeon]|nr:hypothetical protein [Candidatus Bathyarchaeota archaeon]
MDSKGYEYGKNYVYLGYAWANDASVSASATNWQSAIRKDYYGDPITNTFLKDVNDWKDWALICDFPTAHFYSSIINHYALRGTPLIMNCIGVMIALIRPQVDIGTVKAYLGSTRGGAELEYVLGTYGPGLQSMNAFSVLHYVTIGFVIIGNIGYFMYTKKNQRG